MIYSSLPTDWKDLQNRVARIFSDLDFDTEIEKTIKTVRGNVIIDVYAVDKNQKPDVVYLCECKHWEQKIPQAIVHSFRTVVVDFGANYGLLISKNGYQQGAYNAAANTNVMLLDWLELQKLFVERWFVNRARKLYEIGYQLVSYTEPINSTIFKEADKLRPKNHRSFIKLRKKYAAIAFLCLPYQYNGYTELEFPFIVQIPRRSCRGTRKIKVQSYMNLFDLLTQQYKEGIEAFDRVFGKQIRNG